MGRAQVFMGLFLVLLVSGCGPAHQGDSSAVSAIDPVLKGRGPLRQLLVAVATDVANHDWDGFLGRCSEMHFAAQVEDMGMGRPQYIAEMLGLHMVGNSIKLGEMVQYSDLDRLTGVRFDTVEEAYGVMIIKGQAFLKDEPPLKLEIWVSNIGGELKLTGALG